MNKDGGGFQYLKTKFPRISDAKMKEGIFVGPQIRELMKDSNFESTLNEAEQRAWTAFVETSEIGTEIEKRTGVEIEYIIGIKIKSLIGIQMQKMKELFVSGFIQIRTITGIGIGRKENREWDQESESKAGPELKLKTKLGENESGAESGAESKV
ncbi:hypothetical protein EVAR_16910_1 [Eumeta japonica]|uniref:Uncharacterized protein n=1 Tax=Eumeta variegata TaxID=151549 RepID=A0A4C1TVN5_EUMVA|nr:hypothetical protein EVAR_16910_1 [Eumeta japonica]